MWAATSHSKGLFLTLRAIICPEAYSVYLGHPILYQDFDLTCSGLRAHHVTGTAFPSLHDMVIRVSGAFTTFLHVSQPGIEPALAVLIVKGKSSTCLLRPPLDLQTSCSRVRPEEEELHHVMTFNRGFAVRIGVHHLMAA